MPSRQINEFSQKGNKKIELVARPGDQSNDYINKKYWDIFLRGRRGGGGLYEKFYVLYETWLQDFGMGQIDWALCLEFLF